MIRYSSKTMLPIVLMGLGLVGRVEAMPSFFARLGSGLRSMVQHRLWKPSLFGGTSILGGLLGFQKRQQQPTEVVTMKGRIEIYPHRAYDADHESVLGYVKALNDTTLGVRRSDKLAEVKIVLDGIHEDDFPKGCRLPNMIPFRHLPTEEDSLFTAHVCRRETQKTGKQYQLELQPIINQDLVDATPEDNSSQPQQEQVGRKNSNWILLKRIASFFR